MLPPSSEPTGNDNTLRPHILQLVHEQMGAAWGRGQELHKVPQLQGQLQEGAADAQHNGREPSGTR